MLTISGEKKYCEAEYAPFSSSCANLHWKRNGCMRTDAHCSVGYYNMPRNKLDLDFCFFCFFFGFWDCAVNGCICLCFTSVIWMDWSVTTEVMHEGNSNWSSMVFFLGGNLDDTIRRNIFEKKVSRFRFVIRWLHRGNSVPKDTYVRLWHKNSTSTIMKWVFIRCYFTISRKFSSFFNCTKK